MIESDPDKYFTMLKKAGFDVDPRQFLMAGPTANNFDDNFLKWFGDSKIVDEKGSPQVLYHETAAEAKSSILDKGFDLSKGRARLGDDGVPDGIFFKPSEEKLGLGGKDSTQIPVYLSIKNPLVVEDRSELKSIVKNYSSEYVNLQKQQKQIDKEYQAHLDKVWDDMDGFRKKWWDKEKGEYKKGFKKELDDGYMKKAQSILDEWIKVQEDIPNKSRKIINKYLKDNNYDGLILEEDEGSFGRVTKTIIALEPTQVKSTSNLGEWSKDNPSLMRGSAAAPIAMTQGESDDTANFIKSFEGYRDEGYYATDAEKEAGIVTAGYGSTRRVAKGEKITEEQAEQYLQEDIAVAEKAVDSLVKVDLTPNQRAAVVSLVFNVGQGNFKKSKALKALNNGDIETFMKEAFDEKVGFVRSGGKVLAGLVKRRKAEKELFMRGKA
jgi:GH24 family phage-related lysozyme (muramidase)